MFTFPAAVSTPNTNKDPGGFFRSPYPDSDSSGGAAEGASLVADYSSSGNKEERTLWIVFTTTMLIFLIVFLVSQLGTHVQFPHTFFCLILFAVFCSHGIVFTYLHWPISRLQSNCPNATYSTCPNATDSTCPNATHSSCPNATSSNHPDAKSCISRP